MPRECNGLVIKVLGGFYYVWEEKGRIWRCRARGRFRKEATSPMVGDRATVVFAKDDGEFVGSLSSIFPRRNSLVRPPVANLDCLALVVSCRDPMPNLTVIDQLTAIAAHRGIPVKIIFTKLDLCESQTYTKIYYNAGFEVFEVNNLTGAGAGKIQEALAQGITAFCGNSGVGKSSLLNTLFPQLGLNTGEISQKLGRGRHTTRHVELFPTSRDGWIADTPGFSAIDFLQWERMPAAQLEDCFIDFSPYIGGCRYTGCSHTSEPGCAILTAVREGKISVSRHQSYCIIYQQLKNVGTWKFNKLASKEYNH